jgi:hypothetical protein
MAFANTLPEERFSAIYDELQALAHESLLKCKLEKPGFFPNPWVKVINLWTRNRLSNLAIYDMLLTSQVCALIDFMPYQETISADIKTVVA